MASGKQEKVPVACPHCGHTQPEPPSAYSTICKACRKHYQVQEALHPPARSSGPIIEQKQVRCFQCGTDLTAPSSAASTMCKRCSAYLDLSDHRVTATLSKNIRTHGRLVVEEKGYLLNTDSRALEVVVKGRVIGKLTAETTLEIHPTAQIKGSFTAGRLVIPAGTHFHWPTPLQLGGAEIAGELSANLQASGTVRLKATARFFGDIEAANLLVEAGAVFVGRAKVGKA